MEAEKLDPPLKDRFSGLENLQNGKQLARMQSEIALSRWVVWVARLGLVIAVTGVVLVLVYTAYILNRLLTTYDREMMWKRTSINWLILHGKSPRRASDRMTT